MATEESDYDLTLRLIPHLDRHLVLPLLEFLDSNAIYPHDQLLIAKYEALKQTNMITYLSGLHREMNGLADDAPIPDEFTQREQQVMNKLDTLQASVDQIMGVITAPEVVSALRQDKAQNLAYLEKEHDVTLSQIEVLYHHGHYNYSIGNYGGSSDYLYHFRVLSTDNDLVLSSLWGKLASDILEGSFDAALEELNRLKEQLDQRSGYGNPLNSLQQRTWWLHWSLFVYFNHDKGRDALVDAWLGQGYLNTIQTSCPYLLRYLVVALVVSKRANSSSLKGPTSSRGSRDTIKEVLRAVTQEEYQYSDPITDFIKLLYVEVDFEGAQEALKRSEKVFNVDFFLSEEMGAWVESCRTMISEAYCRIHHRIDIGELAKRLGMDGEEGERWIVRLVRDARLDAKIDFKENTVQMNHPVSSVYQTVIERTKRISALSQEQSYKLHTITLSQQDDFKKKNDEGESYRNSNISGRESKKKKKK
ncbi:eIF3 subunit 6 N terminal domain-domain-containing protein, partial [Phakopsora pachyrhizi]